MKYLVMALCLLPLSLWSQEERREATEEEKKLILGGGEDKLKDLGQSLIQQSERSLIEKALVQEALDTGVVSPEHAKSYIQYLTNLGLSKSEIEQELQSLGQKYFSELQLKNIEKLLPEGLKKDLEKKYKEGQISEEALLVEMKKLEDKVLESETTKSNQLKQEAFGKIFVTAIRDNTFVRIGLTEKSDSFTPLKILVAKDFSIEKPSSSDPLCLTQPQVTAGQQIDLLNSQMKSITKPPFHQVWFAWGYNRGYHSKTDVKFTTQDGTFVVHDAVGKDRQTPFDINYFDPSRLTIPQYNLEIGVMFNEKWGMDVHMDHMKYVFDNKRPYNITGNYNHLVVTDSGPVDFATAQANKDATWLRFEHTNGYNYASLGAVYNQNLLKTKNNKVSVDARFGAGAGLVIPKTEVWIFQDQPTVRYGIDNKFHIAGGGVHGDARLKVTFWDSIFIQVATRGTYIKVKNGLVDGAEARIEHLQPIASFQIMGQIGYQHTFGKKKPKKK